MSPQNANDAQPSPDVHPSTAPSQPAPNGTLGVEAIQAWLVDHLAALLECKPEEINVQTDFTDYGLNSIEVVNISGELETFLGQRLDPMLVLEYPNIQVLSEYLGQSNAQVTRSTGTANSTATPQQLLDNLDQMSDEEVDGLLNSMLSEHEPE